MLNGNGLNVLEILDISDNYLCMDTQGIVSDFAMVHLAQAVLRHPTLTALDVSRNGGMSDDASEAGSTTRSSLAWEATRASRTTDRQKRKEKKRKRERERARRLLKAFV